MLTLLTSAELLTKPSSRTIRFEGDSYHANVSFFVVDMEPGQGPELHKHPYAEVFVIRAGGGRFTTGDQDREAGPNEIVVVGPDSPHGFTCVGPDRPQMVCMHCNARMITKWLQPR